MSNWEVRGRMGGSSIEDTPDSLLYPGTDPLNNHTREWLDAGRCWDDTIGSALDNIGHGFNALLDELDDMCGDVL